MAKSNNLYSSLRNSERISLSEQVPLKCPLTIYIEPTNICNFKCVYCPESFSDYKETAGGFFQISPDDFKNITLQIKHLGVIKTLNFYMLGEPFVNKNLINFIKIAKEHNIAEKIIVTSNGALIDNKKYKDICESGLDYLRISIYGANQTSHKFNTQSHIALSKIIKNISGLMDFKIKHYYEYPFIYVKMIERPNKEENQQFIKIFEKIADQAAIEPVMNWNAPEQGNLDQLDEDALLEQEHFPIGIKQVCPFPFYTLVIHADLSVSVCCVDWDKKTNIGNLREESLSDIWNGEKLRNFQLKHIKREKNQLIGCKNCKYLYTSPDNVDHLTEAGFLNKIKR